ncbi:MAG: LysM peptidoglycan-binding domain-containing protein [Nitrospiraceae bacterium]|nr:LysM peptidoglycan-binding domain-containing protein [Nitrospiraceae bacterium]
MYDKHGRVIGTTMMKCGVMAAGLLFLSGCVMSEKYEAEKARSLNFQRLLAQEEKRSAELDSEVKRAKRELAEYEARNRELGAQVEAVRQQAAQIQDEAQAMKEAALLEKRAQEDMRRLTTVPKPKKAEKPAKSESLSPPTEPFADMKAEMKNDLSSDILDFKSDVKDKTKSALGEMETAGAEAAPAVGMTHTVKAGETLYRIGLKYHVSLDKLRKWNNLSKDQIEVGQKLIVSQP